MDLLGVSEQLYSFRYIYQTGQKGGMPRKDGCNELCIIQGSQFCIFASLIPLKPTRLKPSPLETCTEYPGWQLMCVCFSKKATLLRRYSFCFQLSFNLLEDGDFLFSSLPPMSPADINFFFWILAHQPGLEPEAPAVDGQSLNHWTAKKVPCNFLKSYSV